jgi:tRNA threonylcarbamoyladenosine biosynthesis protein TsaB
MHVLALDTTTREGSAALVTALDGAPLQIRITTGDTARAHAERLPGELFDLIRANNLQPSDIDLFAVASGPGSFTGLRIGIATMQGLAFATARPLFGVSALEALADAVTDAVAPGALIASWMDGHRKDVFGALYERVEDEETGKSNLREIDGPTVDAPEVTLHRWQPHVAGRLVSFAGGGAELYADLLGRVTGFEARRLDTPLLAGSIGRLAIGRVRRGERPGPAALQPLYVRRPDAEVARERLGR